MTPYWLVTAIALAFALPMGDGLDLERRGGVELETDLDAASRETVFAEQGFAERASAEILRDLGVTRKNRESVRLVVVAHEADFEDLRRRWRDQSTQVSTLSFYDERARQVVSCWQDGSPAGRGQLRRQCARQVLLQSAKNPPNWFEEGFAGYVEGLEPDEFGDAVDTIPSEHLAEARRALAAGAHCPLFELMELQDPQYYGIGGAENSQWPRATLYAQSWSLVYWMLRSADGEAARFRSRVVERLETGRWPQREFAEELAAAEPAWRAFIEDGVRELPGRSLAAARAALAAGDLATARGAASDALDLDPSSRAALRIIAAAALAEGDHENAALGYDRLLAATPDDVDALLGRARAFAAEAEAEQRDGATERAIEFGKRAAAAAAASGQPSYPGVLLAADAAEAAGHSARALELVREARRMRGLPREVSAGLAEREQRLVKIAIGK